MAAINSRQSSLTRKFHSVSMLKYLMKRSTNINENYTKSFTKKLWDTAKDLYKKDLTAHYGCVNAIEFSGDGNLLFSGGDDRRVLMWNVNSAMMYYTGKLGDGSKPVIMKACHFSNIFCLAIDDENKRVLSGSNDDQVIVHDYTTGNPIDYFLHDSTVFSLSLHPMNGNIFASAADNGRILIYDIRESNSEPSCLAKFRTPFHGVMFNPCEPFLIATANSEVGIHIWDLRKPREVLLECSDEQSMAVRWNQSGTILLALRNLLPPIIYNPRFPKRTLEFDADGYYNACTMKSCSFAGDDDEYMLSGSDDFNLYMWKIPDPWPEDKWIVNAHLTLIGHRSIVNQVRYDPNKQLIASSGVEKIIKIWSPFRMPYSEGDRDKPCSKRSRVLCSSRTCSRSPGLSHDYSQESMDEDTRMIHFFDSLLRNELHRSTPSSVSQICCVDGKLFPVSNRRKEAKAYEQLIIKKKKHLSKILTGKNDDNPPMCSLSQSSNTNENHSKKYHFSLEDNELLTASEDESIEGDAFDSNQGTLENSGPEETTLNDRRTSASSVSSESNARLTSLSSASSSSNIAPNDELRSQYGSPYDSESHLTSDNSVLDDVSDDSSSDSPFELITLRKKYKFSNSESEDCNVSEEKPKCSSNLNDSTNSILGNSDCESSMPSSSFKKRKFSSKHRCYRKSGRRVRLNSNSSCDVESSKDRNTESDRDTSDKSKLNNAGEHLNGMCDQTKSTSINISTAVSNSSERNLSRCDENSSADGSQNMTAKTDL